MDECTEIGYFEPKYPIHRQDQPDYCGVACVQMIIDEQELGALPKQRPMTKPPYVLVNDGVDFYHDPSWKTSPTELANILSKKNVEGYREMGWVETISIDDFKDKLMNSLSYKFNEKFYPPVVIIDAQSHWVVPTSFVLKNEVLDSFYYNDPFIEWRDRVKPVPHTATDICNTLNENGHLPGNFESVNNIIVSYQNISGYTPVEMDSRSLPAMRSISLLGNLPIHNLPIHKEVVLAIEQHRLNTREGWQAILANPIFGNHIKVEQENGKNFDLIPLLNPQKQIAVLIKIASDTRAYQGALKVFPDKYLFPKTSQPGKLLSDIRANIQRELARKNLDNSDTQIKKWTTALDKKVTITQAMWVPCNESISSFFPFYEISLDGVTKLYVRIDGEVFSSLTPDKR